MKARKVIAVLLSAVVGGGFIATATSVGILTLEEKIDIGSAVEPYLQSALDSMKEQAVLASQRNLQYRHDQIMKHNTRMFNCTSGHIARNRVFQEIFYLALSGCGFGGGLSIPFVNNLSRLQKRTLGTKTFYIEDSIEGWSDSLGVLMSSYFVDEQPFTEYAGYEIKFDYSYSRYTVAANSSLFGLMIDLE